MEIVKMLTALTLCATMSAAAGVGAMPADTFEAAEIEVETAEAAVVMNTATKCTLFTTRQQPVVQEGAINIEKPPFFYYPM